MPSPQVPLPSKIRYAAFLQYSPRGQSDISTESRRITRAVKADSFRNGVRIIPFAAKRIAEVIDDYEAMKNCFGPDVTLIPVPRSAPLVKGGLWPSLRLAEEIQRLGLAEKVDPCLERTASIRKSATSKPGERPRPVDHYLSLRVDHEPVLTSGGKVCLIDDVVTRGATLLASHARVQEAFPSADVISFALVRTISEGDVNEILCPVAGTIELHQERTHREP